MAGNLHEARITGHRRMSYIRNDGLSALSWTSSRCHRLLRPLQSRIASLRRIAAVEKSGCEEDSCSDKSNQAARQPPAKRLKVDEGKRGSDGQKKRLQRTYSRKASPTLNASKATNQSSVTAPSRLQSRPRQKRKAPQPGVVATPILRKAKYLEIDDSLSSVTTYQEAENTCENPRLASRGRLDKALNKLEKLRHRYSSSKYQLYEGILHDLDILLRATSTQKGSADKKSLLSMCLRKVPQYAAQVEAWEKLEEQSQRSCAKKVGYSLVVYDELESLGGAGNGWSHLWVLLRAHAIHLLRGVLEDGTLDGVFVHILINHCAAVECHQESAELVESLLCRFHSAPLNDDGTCDNEVQGTFLSLLGLADSAHIASNLLETTSQLLLQRRLPTGLLSTKALSSLWAISASSILDDKTNPSAIRFASTGLSSLSISSFGKRRTRSLGAAGIRDSAALLTLISVLGALSAMAMISQNFGGAVNLAEMKGSSQTQRVVQQILQEAITLVTMEGGGRESSHSLLLAAFLASNTTDTLCIKIRTALQTIWAKDNQSHVSSMAKQSQLYHTTVALVCSIAQCCSKATTQPSNHYFAEICRLVQELQVPGLASLRSDGAFLLAQKTNDLRDLVFAENLVECSPNKSKVTRHREPREAFFSGYRWEEGISEWIAVSPAKRRDVVAQVVANPRRSSRRSTGKEDVIVVYPEPGASAVAAGGPDKSGRPRMAVEAADIPDGPNGRQVEGLRAGKRKADDDGVCVHDSRLEKAQAQDDFDELSTTFQENRVEKSRLVGSAAVKARRGCRRRIRTGETVWRQVVAQLRITSNTITGREDDDELGL